MNIRAKKGIYEDNKLEKRLRRLVGQAISDFAMIADGDLIMVAISGGKDSYAMLNVLTRLQKYAPIKFEVIAVNLDQNHPGFPTDVLPSYLESKNIRFKIIKQDTYSVVKQIIPEGKTMCSLCSRLRRGALYNTARQIGASKIALGHHRDDIIETFFLNLFHGGKIKSMAPKLLSDDGKHIIIRPMAYCKEKDLIKYADLHNFPLIPCDLCGSQPNLERMKIKEMLVAWDKAHPGRTDTIFSSLQSLIPSHLLDLDAFNFMGLEIEKEARESPQHH